MTVHEENWSSLSKIDGELEQHLKRKSGPPLALPADIPIQRKFLDTVARQSAAKQDTTGIQESDSSVAARDGYQIPIRILSPTHSTPGGGPLVVFIHGGGFCVGNLDFDVVHARDFVRHFGAVVVTVDYRLAPEHPFPTGVNDCWDVVQWAGQNATVLSADPIKGFIVGGVSAGGNISAVIGVLARDTAISPPITGLCLLVPGIFGQENAIPEEWKPVVKSHEDNRNALGLDAEAIDAYMKAYNPDNNSKLFNNFAPGNTLRNLPPVYLQVCGMDPLRDEGLVYERVLREEHHIPTKLDIYPGLPHSFWAIFPELKSSQRFLQDTVKGMAWLLEQKQTKQ